MSASRRLLEIDKLAVEIQSMPALRGFTMHLTEGAMVSLVGRNGAGKTTLMRSIMGHLAPRQGTIRSRPRRPRHRLHAGRPRPRAATDR